MSNEIPVVFYNDSNYDYHFIIKKLANKSEGQFEPFWEKKEMYKKSFVPIKQEITKIDKDCNERVATIFYTIKFIDSAKFIASSLSNLVDNLAEGIHKIKCKDSDCFLKYEIDKDNLIKYKSLS